MHKNHSAKKTIPIHTNEFDKSLGFSVSIVENDIPKKRFSAGTNLNEAHRDDHYIFLLQKSGKTRVMIDFEEIVVQGVSLFFIKPGQVHYYLLQQSNGYFLAVDTKLLDDACRFFLDNSSIQLLNIDDSSSLEKLVLLINDICIHDYKDKFSTEAMQNLISGYINLIVSLFNQKEVIINKQNARPLIIANTFKNFIKKYFREYRKPSDYANMLNISSPYLNEIVKRITGFTTSYWIQQEIFLEAKRLLINTNLSAKEIAYQLGFEDYAYFTRLFKKINNVTPIAFREQYSNLSN